MHKDTITLFNRVVSKTGDTWYPTVLHNVHLNVDRAAAVAKYGPDTKDSAILHIHYQTDGDRIMVGKKPWLPPKKWANAEAYRDSITFTSGNHFDFFCEGEWDGGVVCDADYVADGDFYSYMNRTRDLVFAISSVAMYSLIQHFEIVGK